MIEKLSFAILACLAWWSPPLWAQNSTLDIRHEVGETIVQASHRAVLAEIAKTDNALTASGYSLTIDDEIEINGGARIIGRLRSVAKGSRVISATTINNKTTVAVGGKFRFIAPVKFRGDRYAAFSAEISGGKPPKQYACIIHGDQLIIKVENDDVIKEELNADPDDIRRKDDEDDLERARKAWGLPLGATDATPNDKIGIAYAIAKNVRDIIADSDDAETIDESILKDLETTHGYKIRHKILDSIQSRNGGIDILHDLKSGSLDSDRISPNDIAGLYYLLARKQKRLESSEAMEIFDGIEALEFKSAAITDDSPFIDPVIDTISKECVNGSLDINSFVIFSKISALAEIDESAQDNGDGAVSAWAKKKRESIKDLIFKSPALQYLNNPQVP